MRGRSFCDSITVVGHEALDVETTRRRIVSAFFGRAKHPVYTDRFANSVFSNASFRGWPPWCLSVGVRWKCFGEEGGEGPSIAAARFFRPGLSFPGSLCTRSFSIQTQTYFTKLGF